MIKTDNKIKTAFIRFVFVISTLPFLLSSGSDWVTGQESVSPDVSNKDLEIINALVLKARLFESFFKENNILSYDKLFPNGEKKNSIMTISIIHRSLFVSSPKKQKEDKDDTLYPYTILIGDTTESGGYRNLITLQYSNSAKRTLATYSEITQLSNVEIVFFDDGTPKYCHVKYYNKEIGWFDDTKMSRIEWDKSGNVLSKENMEWIRELPLSSIAVEPNKTILFQKHSVKIGTNTSKDQDIIEVLKRAESICLAKSIDDILPCCHFPLFDKKTASGELRIVNNCLQSVFFCCDKKNGEGISGYYISWNKDDNPEIYAEGDISSILLLRHSEKEINSFTSQKTISIDGNGIEVRFHPTGYPATYKTIVKNRLFGRQIEWNDKGEVISDIDLDIPKPWTDVSSSLLNQPEPIVMRTWTSRDGQFSVQAKYLSADETTVTIEKENGTKTTVEISKLSESDQKYVERQRDAKKNQ
ncbi:MAG: hypothetical protein LBJ67_00145 [Planctomycetaceae bacterium]|nr:hypothetical protein [Planctomycetaceae bacterium]